MENKLSWVGFEVHTREAIWVCVESRETDIPMKIDGIEFDLKFEARDARREGIPASRRLCVRTSSMFKVNEPDYLGYLTLVVEGQLIETDPWDRLIEFYKRD